MIKIKNSKKQYPVHAYKYNGWLYRTVEHPYFLHENEGILCLYMPYKKVKTIKNRPKGNKGFQTYNDHHKLWFFFKEHWFNIIVNLYHNSHNFYVNLASPYTIEDGAIKYIDYDLDFKITDISTYRVLDWDEFVVNSEKWNYPDEIKSKVWFSYHQILELIKNKWFEKLMNPEQSISAVDAINIIYKKEGFLKNGLKGFPPPPVMSGKSSKKIKIQLGEAIEPPVINKNFSGKWSKNNSKKNTKNSKMK